jgi:hypothetical protein
MRIKVHGASLEGNLEGNSADREVFVLLPQGDSDHRDRGKPGRTPQRPESKSKVLPDALHSMDKCTQCSQENMRRIITFDRGHCP